MKYLAMISICGVLTSCSLVPFLGGKLAADAENFPHAAEQGVRAALEVKG